MAEKAGKRRSARQVFLLVLGGVVIGTGLFLGGKKAMDATSTDRFCNSCHAHPHATDTWKRSTHYDNRSGVVVHCVECHLPPSGFPYLREKVKTGMRDVYSTLFKDVSSINWEERSRLESAVKHTYEASCLHCHEILFPLTLTKDGEKAHLYYTERPGELRCINCHLHVGHYRPGQMHTKNLEFGQALPPAEKLFTEAARVDSFADFTETIPGSTVTFDMKAIPGGTFRMGTPDSEPFRRKDEGPVREVTISPFFMGVTEVSWDEYLAFFSLTESRGRSSDTRLLAEGRPGVPDAITGPTPPWGNPDQGWGRGRLPAITMTHYAAQVYCEWLSSVTGKTYRLPTEAEWEYACRAGTEGPYFFDGDPRRFSEGGFLGLRKPDTAAINPYVNFAASSQGKPVMPGTMLPNPFGLLHMLGNVEEFCMDYYSPDILSAYPAGPLNDPKGPSTGTEYVVRGGSYRSNAGEVRSGARNYTRTADWLKTDPQIPKSRWWYSDCAHVGFRVVCEFDSLTGNKAINQNNNK